MPLIDGEAIKSLSEELKSFAPGTKEALVKNIAAECKKDAVESVIVFVVTTVLLGILCQLNSGNDFWIWFFRVARVSLAIGCFLSFLEMVSQVGECWECLQSPEGYAMRLVLEKIRGETT